MKLPANFDGAKFQAFYDLPSFEQAREFWVDCNGFFHCPQLPNLTEAELQQFISDPPQATEMLINEKHEI